MNQEKIEALYKELSEHFSIPYPKWEILPKPKLPKVKSETKISPYAKLVSKIEVEAKGRFTDKPIPKIIFYGIPTKDTVYHEFMHYLAYCMREKMYGKCHKVNT